MKVLLIILMLVLIVVDFAAMGDITTGQEPSYAAEYATLLASIPLFCMLSVAFVGRDLHQISL